MTCRAGGRRIRFADHRGRVREPDDDFNREPVNLRRILLLQAAFANDADSEVWLVRSNRPARFRFREADYRPALRVYWPERLLCR